MAEKRNIGDVLQSLPRSWIFILLLILTSVPQFFDIPVPNAPDPSSRALFEFLRSVPKGSTLLIESDWTNSTRGESEGEFKALCRILMRNDVKLAIYSLGDPQAPQVARDTIRTLNEERKAEHQRPYEQWNDYVSIGFFPNAEATATSMQNDIRTAFSDKRDFDPNGALRPVFESPVLANYHKISDFAGIVVVTASNTSVVTIQRITSTKLLMMVTGVMGPETNNYFVSGQVKGLATGLKGVYDIETLMEDQPEYKGMTNLDSGYHYYPTLHLALLLLIVAVLVGNVGMFLSRRKAK